MKFSIAPSVRSRSVIPLISAIFTISFLVLGVLLYLHLGQNIPIDELTRDPATIGRLPIHVGFLSQIGLFFWSAAATICFFSLALLAYQPQCHRIKRFLLSSGLLTLLLGVDDAFLLHEAVFPKIGISEKFVLACYLGLVLFYLVSFYPVLLKTEYVLMGIALFFFGASLLVDGLYRVVGFQYLLEDSAKLIGIVSWLIYFFQVGRYAIDSRTTSRS